MTAASPSPLRPLGQSEAQESSKHVIPQRIVEVGCVAWAEATRILLEADIHATRGTKSLSPNSVRSKVNNSSQVNKVPIVCMACRPGLQRGLLF